MGNPFDQNDNHDEVVNPYEGKEAKEIMDELVGEGKKYASVEEAVKALAHSQHHITTLESETAKLREAQSQSKTIEDVMARLQEKQKPSDDDKGSDDKDPAAQKPTDGEDVEATVKRLLEQQMNAQSASQNKKQVIDAMTKQFGAKAGEVWDKVEKELGVDLDQMSASSPVATLKLLGVTGETTPSQTGASFNGDGKVPKDNGGERPPEGSERLVNYLLERGEITRRDAYHMKLKFVMEDAKKFKA